MCNGMKKAIPSLLGLLLLVSFAFTGCQSGTESEVSTGEPASSAVTRVQCFSKQNGDGNGIRSTRGNGGRFEDHCGRVPVEVRFASDGQYRYEYDKNEYAVTTTTNGSTFEIKVTDRKPETNNEDNVIVYIPDQSYGLITGVSEGSSLILPAINANITVTSNASSVMASLPSDYNKTLNYTGNTSSCSLSMGGVHDFAVNAKISTSSVSVPSSWPAYDMLSTSYDYTSGNGTSKINIDVTSSSFVFSDE